MRAANLRMAWAIVFLLGMLSLLAISGEPEAIKTGDSLGQEITVERILNSLYFEGRIFLPVNFGDSKGNIQEDSQPIIDNIVSAMNLNPGFGVTVVGYDISAGETAAENRAQVVMAAIIAQGIDPGRLTATGQSKSKSTASSGSIELVIKPVFLQDSIPPAPSTEHFGVQVYPGAEFNNEQTRFVRNIYGIDEFAYTTTDDFNKVVGFYKKLEGFMPFGESDTSAGLMKITDSSMVKVNIASPWTDMKTKEVQSNTLIEIMNGE